MSGSEVQPAPDEVRKLPRERCPKCKQMIVRGSRRVGAPNRHDCAALGAATAEWSLLYRCTRCEGQGRHTLFTGLSNVGQWGCRRHPGVYTEAGGYSCCGRKRHYACNPYLDNGVWSRQGQLPPLPFEPEGCTPCDHFHADMPRATSALARPLDVERDIPTSVISLMDPPAPKRLGFVVELHKGLLRGSGTPPRRKQAS